MSLLKTKNNPLKPKISIIIPAFNEESRLPRAVRAVGSYLEANRQSSELVIVIEKSSDRTLQKTKEEAKKYKNIRIIANNVHRGKGFAVKTGFLASRGSFVIFMDADLSTDLIAIDQSIDFLENNPSYDVVIGSRSHPESVISIHQNRIRELMGKMFNLIARVLLGIKFHDTQCGFKVFRHDSGIRLFKHMQTNGFAFDVELLFLAKKLGYKVSELPVKWENSKDSKVKILSSPLAMFSDLIKIYIAH